MNSIDGVDLNEASRDDLRDLVIGLAHEREALQRNHDALAAHLERIRKFWMLIDRDVCTHAERVKLNEIIESAPETSLDQRDARMKAEGKDQ